MCLFIVRMNVLLRMCDGKKVYLPNGCNPSEWKGVKAPFWKSGQPITVGYVGTMAHWFDAGVLYEAVDKHENMQIELVGPLVTASLPRGVPNFPNIK